MFSKFCNLLIVAIAAGVITAGCDSIGQTPPGGSPEEVKNAFDKLPLEERAKLTLGSPMPYDQKVAKIKEMYAKEGKEPPADLLKGGTAH